MSEYIIYLRTLCNAFIFPYSKHNNVPTHTDPDPIISQTPASAVLPISHSTPNTLALLMFFKETNIVKRGFLIAGTIGRLREELISPSYFE